MNNFNKHHNIICLIIFFIVIFAGLTSCGEKGGIIAVENNRATIAYFVRISNTSGYSGGSMGLDRDISPGKTSRFEIENDGTYWVLISGIRYKKVSVSGGGTVHVIIE